VREKLQDENLAVIIYAYKMYSTNMRHIHSTQMTVEEKINIRS